MGYIWHWQLKNTCLTSLAVGFGCLNCSWWVYGSVGILLYCIIVYCGYLSASIRPSLHVFFLSVFHLLHSLCLLSLCTFPVCFISFIPSPLLFFMLFLFPSSSLLSFPVILSPFYHPLHCILSFACSSSSSHFEPAHAFLSFPFFLFYFNLHSHFGCNAGAG